MAETVKRNAVVKLRADNTGLRRGLRTASRSLKSFGRGVSSLRLGTVGVGAAAVGAAAAVTGAVVGKKIANQVDSVAKLARNWKTTSEQVEVFDLAVKKSGAQFSDVSKAVDKFSAVIGKQLITPSKEVGDALDKAGLSAEKLGKMAPLERFKALGIAMSKLRGNAVDPNSFEARYMTKKQRAAQQDGSALRLGVGRSLIGKGAASLETFFDGFDKNISASQRHIASLGLNFDDSKTGIIEKFNDSFEDTVKTFELLGKSIIIELGPGLLKGADAFKNYILEFARANGGFANIAILTAGVLAKAFGSVAENIQIAADKINAALTNGTLDKGIESARSTLQGVSNFVDSPGATTLDAVRNSIQVVPGGAADRAANIGGEIADAIKTAFEVVARDFAESQDGGNQGVLEKIEANTRSIGAAVAQ